MGSQDPPIGENARDDGDVTIRQARRAAEDQNASDHRCMRPAVAAFRLRPPIGDGLR
jgi:hypothetical protein